MNIEIDLADCVVWGGIIALCILFAGTPDLMDAIMFALKRCG